VASKQKLEGSSQIGRYTFPRSFSNATLIGWLIESESCYAPMC